MPLSKEQKEKIIKIAPFMRPYVIAKAMNVAPKTVDRFVTMLKQRNKLVQDIALPLTYEQCETLLEGGTVRLNFFKSSHKSSWTQLELDFLEDSLGVLSDFEIAHWLGRSLHAVEHRRWRILGLRHAEDAGFFSSKDVIECLGINKDKLSREKIAGKIKPVDTTPARDDIFCSVGKLRYSLKELTKEGKFVSVNKIASLFKRRKFIADQYEPEQVTEYIINYMPDKPVVCLVCGKQAINSSLCPTCS